MRRARLRLARGGLSEQTDPAAGRLRARRCGRHRQPYSGRSSGKAPGPTHCGRQPSGRRNHYRAADTRQSGARWLHGDDGGHRDGGQPGTAHRAALRHVQGLRAGRAGRAPSGRHGSRPEAAGEERRGFRQAGKIGAGKAQLCLVWHRQSRPSRT